MQTHGMPYQIERDGEIVNTIRGLATHKKPTGRACIAFYPDSDVRHGDWLIDPTGKRLFVCDTETGFAHQQATQLRACYQTESEFKSSKSPQQAATFSIGSIHGQAIVGNQHHFSFSQGVSTEELLALISEKPVEDQALLKELAGEIKNRSDIKPGMLQRFGTVLAKYSDIAIFVGKILLAFAVNKNP